ncbi:MAG TPA: Ig-like domain-containing protein, partial [Clostridia bacterium]|nr:Ig-like domain-containing protein [Clostridia bacterium]
QKVKDSSIVVMWETDRPAGSRVDYGVGSADEVQITDATPATIHEVTLTGLAPNTLYHYTVASDYAVSGEASFQTALGTPEESFRWVVYGDTQVPATHQAVIDSILVNNPLPRFVLHVGDLVEQGRMHNDWGTFFSPAGPMLRQIPLFPTLGDHEYLGTEQMWYFDFFNLPENGTASGTEEWYAFTYGSVRFIALNSAASFGPGSAQHNWLLSELQSDAFQNAGWKIVFLHQGPYANQTPDLVAADLVPLFHQYGVHLVFNGHDHNYRHIYRQDPATGRRVDYITTGGGGAALTTPVGIPDDPTLGLVKAGAVHHYCVLDVSPGSLAFKAVDTSGGIIDAITFYDITDTSPPVITGVAATNVSDTTATITWATDESANAVVQYAPGATWFEAGDPLFMTAHNIVLSGLTPSTLYSYQVISTDPAGNSAQSPVLSFTTRHQNFAPLALDGSMSLDEDAHLSGFQLLATDENGDTLNFHIVSGPAHGLLGGTPPILDYWPEPNYSGTDSFTFTADDGFLVSAPATITINVNAVPDAPTAPDDLTATAEDRTITLNWVPGSDVEGDALTYTIYRNESLVAQNVTGTSFVDSDLANGTTYSYRVRTADSTGLVSPASNEASAIPSKPDFNAYVVQNPMVEIGSLISGNFSDLLAEDGAGQILQEAKVGLFGQLKAQYVLRTVAKPSEVAGLTLVLNATTLTAIDDPGWYLFAWNGTTWDRVGDLTVGTSTLEIALDPARHLATDGTVLISLQDGANRKRENLDRLSIDQLYARVLTGGKPTAKEDAYTTSEDVVLMIPVPGLLGNDSDPENGQLSAMLVSGPANGLLSLNADGSFVYTPRADFNGADTFSYKAGNGLVDSLPVTVTITVAPVNDAPLAVADAYNMTQGTTLSITAAGVLANDDDADGNALTVSLSAAPSNGNLALAADGSFTYTPSAGFTGVETFSYVAGDGSENSQPATVTITVTAASSTPKIHVAGMAMGIDSGRKNIKGTVMVMVLDQEGIAVAGATVSGGWQLGENAIGSASGVTDASGTVVLASVPVKDTSGSFTFTVNNIALAGADYDPQANVLTSATISF